MKFKPYEIPKIKIPTVTCKRCKHVWTPFRSGDVPYRCPRCGRRRWWLTAEEAKKK